MNSFNERIRDLTQSIHSEVSRQLEEFKKLEFSAEGRRLTTYSGLDISFPVCKAPTILINERRQDEKPLLFANQIECILEFIVDGEYKRIQMQHDSDELIKAEEAAIIISILTDEIMADVQEIRINAFTIEDKKEDLYCSQFRRS